MDFSLSEIAPGTGPVVLPDPVTTLRQDPGNYVASPGLLAAAEAAMYLGQPLLLTGEPGCGKSSFAGYLRHRLRRTRDLRSFCRSNMEVSDLFYTYDEIGRYQAGQGSDPYGFLSLVGCGEAILRASDPAKTAELRQKILKDRDPMEQTREVVLIDEIDKAPRDVPNDLLAMMSGEAFVLPIPQLSRDGAPVSFEAPLEAMPFFVITSNSERALPEPFLRRCAYFHIDFPETETLKDILDGRVVGVDRDSALVRSAIDVVLYARGNGAMKKPSLAELIGFVQVMLRRGHDPNAPLTGTGWHADARATLFKLQEDRDNEGLLRGAG